MKFRECSIAGKKLKADQVDTRLNAENEQDPNTIQSSSQGFNSNLNQIKLDAQSELFFTSLAVCHTVIPETIDGKLTYNASSPDEKALVEGSYNFSCQNAGCVILDSFIHGLLYIWTELLSIFFS